MTDQELISTLRTASNVNVMGAMCHEAAAALERLCELKARVVALRPYCVKRGAPYYGLCAGFDEALDRVFEALKT